MMPSSQTTPQEPSEYFIAICQRRKHSFVTVGLRKKSGIHVLASLGKCGDKEEMEKYPITSNCKLGLGTLEAIIVNERDNVLKEKARAIQYKAYAITQEQYKALLSNLLTSNWYLGTDFTDFSVAVEDHKNNELLETNLDDFSKTTSTQPSPQQNSKHRYFSLINTCRHFAIDVTQQFSYQQNLGRGISGAFFLPPPLKTRITRLCITPDPYFYILPLPPNAYRIPAEQVAVFQKLYLRLDHMSVKESLNPKTYEKFEALKSLYQNLVKVFTLTSSVQPEENKPPQIQDLIRTIFEWEETHQSLIKTHRNHYRFNWMTTFANQFKTSTEILFEGFHQQFPNTSVT